MLQEIKDLLEKQQGNLQPCPDTNVWLDATDVKKLLNISDATIYRRRMEANWVCKKVGGKWFYLKSSIY